MRIPAPVSIPQQAHLIGRRLAECFNADRVFLFGSYARGAAGPDSDLDFLVVVPSSEKSRYKRAVDALGFIRDIRFPADIIVLTRTEWEKEIRAPSSLSSTVLREGVVLHQ